MVMTAGSTDLRKVAEAGGGGLPQAKLRKYASEMGSITRWVSVYLARSCGRFLGFASSSHGDAGSTPTFAVGCGMCSRVAMIDCDLQRFFVVWRFMSWPITSYV